MLPSFIKINGITYYLDGEVDPNPIFDKSKRCIKRFNPIYILVYAEKNDELWIDCILSSYSPNLAKAKQMLERKVKKLLCK